MSDDCDVPARDMVMSTDKMSTEGNKGGAGSTGRRVGSRVGRRVRNFARRFRPGTHLEWGQQRWYQTLLFQLFWPGMVLGTIYVALFFFLNSSFAVQVIEAQLNANLSGQFEIEDVAVGPWLNRIEIEDTQLNTPEGEHVIFADRITVQVDPLDLLGSLLTRNQLKIANIDVYEADVNLEFDEYGPFNLLRVVSPANPSSSEGDSDFSVKFENINIHDSHSMLSFDGFVVDLHDVSIKGFSMTVGTELTMNTAPSALGDYGVECDYGEVRFEPRMFSFPMGEFGHPDQGLAFESTDGGRTHHLARLYTHSGAALALVGDRLAAELGHEGPVPGLRAVRDRFVIPFENVVIEDYWWRRMTFGFKSFEADLVGGGHLSGRQPWMNVAPTEEEVASSAQMHGHTPSSDDADDLILFKATMELVIPGNHPALAWFIGPVVESDAPLRVVADMSGDVGRAEGSVVAIADDLVVSGIEMANVRLAAELEGQRLDFHELTSNLLTGAVEVSGHYMILDGDFAFDVALGEQDPDQDFARVLGVDGGSLVPENVERFLAGEMTGALTVERVAERMTLTLEEPLKLVLSTPLPGGGQTIVVRQFPAEGEEPAPLIIWENRILRVGDDASVKLGRDEVTIDGGATMYVDEDRYDGVRIKASLGDIGEYAAAFEVAGLRTDRVEVELRAMGHLDASIFEADVTVIGASYGEDLEVARATLDGRWVDGQSPDISAKVGLSDGRYQEYEVQTASLDARYVRGKVHVHHLAGDTNVGKVEAQGWLEPFRSGLSRLRKDIPWDLQIAATDVDLSLIPQLNDYDAAGVADANVHLTGTSTNPRATGDVSAADLQGFNEYVPALVTDFTYRDGVMGVTSLHADYGEARPATDGSLRRASIDVTRATFAFDTFEFEFDGSVNRLHLTDLEPLQDAVDLSGVASLRMIARGDLHALLGGGSVSAPVVAEGRIGVDGMQLGDRYLGDVNLALEQRGESVGVTGTVFEVFEIDGETKLARPLKGSTRISFRNLNWLDAVPELAEAINGDAEAHKRVLLVRDEQLPLSEFQTTGYVDVGFSESGALLAQLHLDKLRAVTYEQLIRNYGPIELTYRHRSGAVEIGSFELETGGKHLKLSGSGDLDGILDLEVNGEVNVALASLFAGDSIADPTGALTVSVDVTGDMLDGGEVDLAGIRLGGFVGVREPVQLRIRGLTEPLVVNSGIIRIADQDECLFSGTTCYLIPSGLGLQGRVLGGTFNLRGEIVRDGPLPVGGLLTASASNLSYRLKNEATVTFNVPDANLFVLDLNDLESEPPVLSGSVEVTEGRYYKDYNIQSELLEQRVLGQVLDKQRRSERYEQPIWQQIPLLALLQLDINVASSNGIRVENEVAGAQVDIELTFDLRVQGTLAELSPTGIVDVRDGRVRFRRTEFEVMPGGQLTFTGDLNARLDLTAQAEISAQQTFAQTVVRGSDLEARRRLNTSNFGAGSQTYIITLSLSGRLQNPVYDLESQPILNDTNIITLVLTGRTLDDLNADREQNPAFDIALSSIIAPLFEAQVDELLAADQFKFTFAEGAAQFVYVNQVSREFSVAAGVSIRGSEGNEQAISANYKFSDSWLLELSGENTIQEEGKAPIPKAGARVRWRIPLD